MFQPTRDEVRQFFFELWRHYGQRNALTPAQAQGLDVVLKHPEYHPMLDMPERYQERDYPPELGETNPFLHLSLHLAIQEQRSIDQPPGFSAEYMRLARKLDDAHAAEHEIMECLVETLWRSQSTGEPPDNDAYLDCIRRR